MVKLSMTGAKKHLAEDEGRDIAWFVSTHRYVPDDEPEEADEDES